MFSMPREYLTHSKHAKIFFKGMNEIGAYQGKVRGSIGCEPPTEEILEKFLYYFQVSLYLHSLRYRKEIERLSLQSLDTLSHYWMTQPVVLHELIHFINPVIICEQLNYVSLHFVYYCAMSVICNSFVQCKHLKYVMVFVILLWRVFILKFIHIFFSLQWGYILINT